MTKAASIANDDAVERHHRARMREAEARQAEAVARQAEAAAMLLDLQVEERLHALEKAGVIERSDYETSPAN